MRGIGFAVALAAATLGTGCASIVSDSDYQTTFNSTPAGAQVTITNENGIDIQRSATPFTTSLSASDGYFDRMAYTARFDHPCYESVTIPLKGGLDGWYFGNILFGGPIGLLLVDPLTGAMFTVDPNYSVALPPSPDSDCANQAADHDAPVPPYRASR